MQTDRIRELSEKILIDDTQTVKKLLTDIEKLTREEREEILPIIEFSIANGLKNTSLILPLFISPGQNHENLINVAINNSNDEALLNIIKLQEIYDIHVFNFAISAGLPKTVTFFISHDIFDKEVYNIGLNLAIQERQNSIIVIFLNICDKIRFINVFKYIGTIGDVKMLNLALKRYFLFKEEMGIFRDCVNCAITEGHLNIVEIISSYIIEDEYLTLTRDRISRMSMISRALWYQDLSIVKFLLQRHYNTKVILYDIYNVFIKHGIRYSSEIINLLRVKNKDLLILAASYSKLSPFKLLFSDENNEDLTPLMISASGNLAVMKFLIDKNAPLTNLEYEIYRKNKTYDFSSEY